MLLKNHKETRYFIAIQFYDENNNKQKVAFGTTMAIKSENYFSAFYKSFIDTLSKVNPKSLSGEPITENTTQDLATQLEKLSQLKEKGMLTDEEFIAAKSNLLNNNPAGSDKPIQKDQAEVIPIDNAVKPPSPIYKVKLKGPDDAKKLYFAQRDFFKDAGVSIGKAKELLISGTTMSFNDKKEAMKFIEKYSQMGCKTELSES